MERSATDTQPPSSQPGGVDEQRKEENDLGNENMNFISRRVFVVIIVGTSQQVQEERLSFFSNKLLTRIPFNGPAVGGWWLMLY